MRFLIRGLAALTLLFACHGAAAAQTHQESWRAQVKEIAKLRAAAKLEMGQNIERAIDINLNLTPFVLFVYEQGLTRELRLVEDARTDKQLGAPPAATGGSTSLVSKGGVPAILAFAVEHGALTQTVNDTSVTLRGNAVGWLDLLQNQDVIASYDDDSRFVRALRRASYSFTFDAAPTSPAPTEERPDPEEIEQLSEGAERQLTAYSIRVSLIDQRDPRRSDNRAAAQTMLQGAGVDLLSASAFLDPVVNSSEYRVWLQNARVALAAEGQMDEATIERVLYAHLEQLRQLMIQRIPEFEAGVIRFVKALRTFDGARTAWFRTLQQRFMMAAEMVRTRPPSKAATSTFRVIAEGRPGKSLWDLAGNFAVTYQDAGTAFVPEPKPTAGWRDIQLAFLAERPLGRLPLLGSGGGIGPPVFAFEYLSRKLFDKAVVTFAGHDFNVEPGWIHAAQARITIPVKGSGVKMPLSVSYANRTELLSEKTVRAHFGFTFDLDVLASAVRR